MKNFALLVPSIKRLHEERERLRRQLRETRHQLTEARAHFRSQQPINRLIDHLERQRIDLVLDVGANEGQYASRLRKNGFSGRIISFEPLSTAFEVLQRACDHDNSWSCHGYAIGEKRGKATINISANSMSSSLLPVCPWTVRAEPTVAYVGQEIVDVRRLR